MDWFQAYKHVACSVGVVFISIMNLPRFIRFKRENVILVGIIPVPNEPSNINTYLKPLVDELLQLWDGLPMSVQMRNGIQEITVKVAILCVACDIPAGRKVCGFLGHSAKLGCTRCLKHFPGTVGSMDYSGFERHLWTVRSVEQHRRDVVNIKKCDTKQQRSNMESGTGCRYSILLKLPYFNPPRMLAIDPMHNLFFGSGKKMMNVWLDSEVITSSHLSQIQQVVDGFVAPIDIGRIPSKFETGFSGITADQLKTWITLFLIPALYNILPEPDLECWRHFVLACRILCKHTISLDDIQLADALLLAFCHKVQDFYGKQKITPNMHMHSHLKEVLLDYGPVHSFWLFCYERFNGILGNQPTNNRAVEPQLMRRFLQEGLAFSFPFPDDFKVQFMTVCRFDDSFVGSLDETVHSADCSSIIFPKVAKRGVFVGPEMDHFSQLIHKLNPTKHNFILNSVHLKYSSLNLHGKNYNCAPRKTGKAGDFFAMIKWNECLYGDYPTPIVDPNHPSSCIRPAKIHYFVIQS